MQTRNICLLGFTKAVENRLRELIEKHAQNIQINWVNANNKALNAVVINALFVDTPQVSKFIKAVGCPCLCAFSGKQGYAAAQETHLMSLDLDSAAQTDEMWFSITLGLTNPTFVPNKVVAVEPKKTDSFTDLFNKTRLSSDYRKLIDIIDSKRDILILAKYGEDVTWILPDKQLAYINYPRENITGIENWQWTECNEQVKRESLRKMRLEQWLFETIWQSTQNNFKIEQQALFQLLRWPQPLSKEGRTEALRIAAQIKLQPASVADLLNRTQYDKTIIEKFLYAAVKAGQIKRLNTNQPIDPPKPKPERPKMNDTEKQYKRSFLSKLRQKLRLGF